MATFNEKRRQWQWIDQEREDRKQPVRQVQREVEKLEEQVRRIKRHTPQFAEQAEIILNGLVSGLGKLLGLNLTNRGPKYHALSPEEVDALLAAFPALLKPWHELTASHGFVTAVRSVNRAIRRTNAQVRAHNEAVAAAENAVWEQARPAFELLDKGDVMGALGVAAKQGWL